MAQNDSMKVAEVEDFYKEAQKRGVYTSAQDSLIAAWKTLSSSVLPSVGVDVKTMTVGELKEQLRDLLKQFGAKSNVKAATIQTYEAKGFRLLADFIEYNGAPDTKWFEWKQKVEKRSAQAAAAASTRHAKKNGRADVPPASDDDTDLKPDLARHPLRLPNKRLAELQVPVDLTHNDILAMEAQFTALMQYLKAQVDANEMSA